MWLWLRYAPTKLFNAIGQQWLALAAVFLPFSPADRPCFQEDFGTNLVQVFSMVGEKLCMLPKNNINAALLNPIH
jgi:hypothetical protein